MSLVWKSCLLLALVSAAVLGFEAWRNRGAGGPALLSRPHASHEAPPAPVDLEGIVVVALGQVDVEEGNARLNPQVSGRIEKVVAREGQRVAAGEPLLYLDDALARAAAAAAEGALAEAQARLEAAELGRRRHAVELDLQELAIETRRTQLDMAQRDFQRADELFATSTIPASEHDAAASRLKVAQAAYKEELKRLEDVQLIDPEIEVRQASAALATAAAQLEMARQRLAQHTLAAPADGLVLRVLAAAGEVVGPRRVEPAIWFRPAAPCIVRCELAEEFAAQVAPGMLAEIIDDGDGVSRLGTGVVTRCAEWMAPRRMVLDDPRERTDVRTRECIVAFHQPPASPLIGKRVRVYIRRAGSPPGQEAP